VQNRISGTESDVSTLQSGLSSEVSARSAADTNLNNQISALKGAVGSPLVAATAAAMTDTSKIYVYTGNQSGYTNGNWYYYSGSAWVSGGVYNETALETDKTLAVEDKAADAKTTGDAITELKNDISQIDEPYGVNLFNFDTVKRSVFLNSTTGAEEVNPTYNASDYIAATAGSAYTIRTFVYSGTTSYRIYFYTTDKTYIRRTVYRVADQPTGFVFTTPSDCAYIRLNFETKTNASGTQDETTTILVQGNTTISEYIPYYTAYDRTARNILTSNAVLTGGTGYTATDANDLDVNRIYYTSPNRITANYPTFSVAAYIVTIPLNGTNKLQLAYSAYGTAAQVRTCVNGTWGAWRDLSYAENTIVNHLTTYDFTDLNAISDNSIYYTSPSRVTENYPAGLGTAYVWTTKLDATNKMQIAYSAYGRTAYIRSCVNGTWEAWHEFAITEQFNRYVTKAEAYETSTIALFPSVGCCGDSFTAGYLYNKTDSPYYDPDYVPNGEYPAIGYPAVMGRLYGIAVTAYAKGGLTSGAYRTDTKGLPALLADDPKYLYIIALGLNDKTQNVPLGVEADIDTEPSTPTYLGNMGAIIRAIKAHAPYARIILCKSLWMNTAYYNYISDGVNLLSSHLGIPYIETLGDPYFDSSVYKDGLKGLHPTAPLYAGIGKRIGELVGKCVIDNPNYFYNFYVPNI